MNIYRNDKNKLKRIELKERIRNSIKQEKKEVKKEQKKRQIRNEKDNSSKEVEKISYFDNIIDKYFSEADKDNLIGTHNNVKNFYKDVKSVFRLKK